jgi:hypothetical protein
VPTTVRYPLNVQLAVILTSLQNIFAEKLGSLGLNPFKMLVVDLMHEFELGVWKAVFSHLVSILYAAGASGRLVVELDRRYVTASSREHAPMNSLSGLD